MIALNSPLKPDLKKLTAYLEKVNDSGWYTNFGPLQIELKARLEDYLGVKNLLLVNNGTSALQVAAKTLKTESVITTPFSFVATSSAFLWQNSEIAFADINKQSYNLSPSKVTEAFAQGCKADTIVATHVYGNPCDVEGFTQIAESHNKKVIYDAAHAFGIKLNGNSVLNYGDASTLSFHATKVFHTVEGGAIVFKRADDYEKAKELINFGINSNGVITDAGTNAKLNEYQAAVGLVNLEEIDNILAHRTELFQLYCETLKDYVEIPNWHTEANENGAYMPIVLNSITQRESVSKALSNNGIQHRRYFSPALDSTFPHCNSYNISESKRISETVLCLPLHNQMTVENVIAVAKGIKEGLI